MLGVCDSAMIVLGGPGAVETRRQNFVANGPSTGPCAEPGNVSSGFGASSRENTAIPGDARRAHLRDTTIYPDEAEWPQYVKSDSRQNLAGRCLVL